MEFAHFIHIHPRYIQIHLMLQGFVDRRCIMRCPGDHYLVLVNEQVVVTLERILNYYFKPTVINQGNITSYFKITSASIRFCYQSTQNPQYIHIYIYIATTTWGGNAAVGRDNKQQRRNTSTLIYFLKESSSLVLSLLKKSSVAKGYSNKALPIVYILLWCQYRSEQQSWH